MADMERLKALQDALKRKDEEIGTLQRRFPDIVAREDERDRLKGEIVEIQDEMKMLMNKLMAEKFAEQARSYIAMAQDMVAANQNELVGVFKLFLSTIIGLRTGLEPQLDELSKLRAQSAFRDYTYLKDVGFKQAEAFQILLAKIKPAGASDMASVFAQTATTKAVDKTVAKVVAKAADKTADKKK